MPVKNTAYVTPTIAGILSLFDPALDWSADLSGDEYATALKEYLVVNQEGSVDPRRDYELDGDTLALAVNIGDGTLSSVGELNMQMNLQYTGDPAQDISENGIFHTLAFECVDIGTSDNNEALEIELFNGESQSAW